ncbi:MAG: PepSY domain-containing protein [Azonexus sp.]|uniref:PepSY domain-containing protein n=1 Tax=Azonexus sp. TaxID=1872668 RepID=UPI00282C0B23|nr:PepSY domain-containing protein [Azonexus sp.]MDR0777563.1 PepSY domain-containing protein [Azonexus sp.]
MFAASLGASIAADERAAAAGAWMPITQLIERLEADGYRDIEEIERDDGRYEVRATDRQGVRVKLYLHRQTGELLDQNQERRRRDSRPVGTPPAPTPAPAR